MKKILLHYLLGDVHLGGHDVHRVHKNYKKILEATGTFEVFTVCDHPDIGDVSFDEYLDSDMISECDAIIFNAGNYRFNIPSEQKKIEDAVSSGKGFIFLHGDHPCYWVNVGMEPWEEVEKMAMMMWREKTSHGDFGNHYITIEDKEHPITAGLTDFDTRDEIFCGMENVHNVPVHVLATAFSDKNVVSRHGEHGTGNNEPVVFIGNYNKGRLFDMVLGHVWPFNTGHGMGEETMVSFSAPQFRQMFVRGCEWAATGEVVRTKDYNGYCILE